MNSIEPVTPPAYAAVEAADSPFVPMTRLHRILVGGLVAAFPLWVGVQQLLNPTSIAAMPGVLLALAANFILMLLPLYFYRSSYGWFHPLIFGLFLGLGDHLRRLDVYVNGLPWHEALPGWSPDSLTGLLVFELILQAAALVAWYCGFFFSPALRAPQVIFGRSRSLGPKVFGVVLFSLGVFAAYMQTRGGIVSHLLSWGHGRNAELAGEFYWQFLIQFGLIACLSWLIIDRHALRNPLFGFSTVLSLGITFLSGGSRSSVIYFMIMGLIAWFLREKKIAFTQIVSLGILAVLLLGLLGNFRNSTFSGEINWDTLTGAAPTEAPADDSALNAGMDEVTTRGSVYAGVFPILALVPGTVDYLYGSSYLAVLTLPVPRGLWPEKPDLAAGMVGQTFFDINVGMPPGPIGEAFWNFGIPGVLLVFFLFGVFCRWLTIAFVQYAREPAAIVLYTITLFLLPEPSGLAVISWLLTLVPALLLLLMTGTIALRNSPSNR